MKNISEKKKRRTVTRKVEVRWRTNCRSRAAWEPSGAAKATRIEPTSRSKRSDFEDYRKDQRALRSLLVDVTLEINPDFLFDDGPVGALFGIGGADRPQ